MATLHSPRRRLCQLQQRRVTVCRGGRLPPQRARERSQLCCRDAPGLEALRLWHVLLQAFGSKRQGSAVNSRCCCRGAAFNAHTLAQLASACPLPVQRWPGSYLACRPPAATFDAPCVPPPAATFEGTLGSPGPCVTARTPASGQPARGRGSWACVVCCKRASAAAGPGCGKQGCVRRQHSRHPRRPAALYLHACWALLPPTWASSGCRKVPGRRLAHPPSAAAPASPPAAAAAAPSPDAPVPPPPPLPMLPSSGASRLGMGTSLPASANGAAWAPVPPRAPAAAPAPLPSSEPPPSVGGSLSKSRCTSRSACSAGLTGSSSRSIRTSAAGGRGGRGRGWRASGRRRASTQPFCFWLGS